MNRSMKKAIEDYNRMIEKGKNKRYLLYVSDVCQLYELSDSKVDVIINALKAGFMIGYKVGRKDQKEGRR